MRIDCESCGAAYTIDDALIGERGVRAQCPKCGAQKVVKKDAAPAPSAPAPTAPAPNPFAPAPGASASRSSTSAGTNPFGGAANPFATPPAAAASNPFAPSSGPSPGGANPFAAPSTGAAGDPFAGLAGNPLDRPAAPKPPPAASAPNPFASPPAPAAANPFAAPPGGTPASSNPFGGAPAATNPFGAAPLATNPFAGAPAGTPNPFAGPPASTAPNPFAPKPASAAASPFGPPPGGAPNPFGAAAAAPAPNPFGAAPAAPSGGANPFAGPPTGAAPPANPFGGPPTGAAPAPNPFGAAPASSPFGASAASNPFGGVPSASSSTDSLFGAPDSSAMKNPFASPPPAAAKPAAPSGSDPFGGPTSESKPAPGGGDPFAAFDARAKDPDFGAGSLDLSREPEKPKPAPPPAAGDDDPFADIAEAPKPATDAAAPSTTKWRVEARGGATSEVTLDEVREMIRAGQIGPNDKAAPVGKPLTRIADSAILAVSLPKSASLPTSRAAAGVRASGGGLGKAFFALVVVGAVVGGGYVLYTSRPDLLQPSSNESVSPFKRALPQWSLQFPDIQGTSQEHVVEGRKFMRQDTAIGYKRADEYFRRALLVDVSNKDAVAAYVENYANLPNVSSRSDPEGVTLAFEGLDHVLVQDPANALLNRAYGALKLATGEVDEAQRYLSQATRAAPDDADAKLWLARAQLDRDTAEALRLIEVVQRQDPGLKAALVVAGAAHRRLGNYTRARTFLSSRLESDPANVPALRELARLEIGLGNPTQAVSALRKLLEADENDVDARLTLAKVLAHMLDKSGDAERELKLVVESYASHAGELILPAYAHFGYLRVLRGDFDGGLEMAGKALALDAGYAPAMLVVGRAKLAKGDLAGAKDTLELAVRTLASSRTDSFFEPLARTLLADVQVKLGDVTNAIRNYNQVIDYDPRAARAFFGAAAAYMISDQPRQAVTVMRRALDVDPALARDLAVLSDYPTPRSDLLVYADAFKAARPGTAGAGIKDAGEGLIRLHAGQGGQAETLLKRALVSDRENHAALLPLGVLYLDEKRNPEAVAMMRRAIKGTGATHALTSYYLARAELATGKVEDALKRLTDVGDSDQALFQARYWRGHALLKQGKRDPALDVFRQILRDNPDYLPVKRTLAELGADG